MKLRNLIKRRFGNLKVITRAPNRGKATCWTCECICGRRKDIAACHLVSGAIHSCGTPHPELGEHNNGWRGYGEIGRRYFEHIHHEARVRDLRFSISIRGIWKLFLKQNRRCALSGVPLTFERKDGRMVGTASIDRIDSTKGYLPDNVQWVHKDINFMKRNLPEDRFLTHCRNICKHHFSHW